MILGGIRQERRIVEKKRKTSSQNSFSRVGVSPSVLCPSTAFDDLYSSGSVSLALVASCLRHAFVDVSTGLLCFCVLFETLLYPSLVTTRLPSTTYVYKQGTKPTHSFSTMMCCAIIDPLITHHSSFLFPPSSLSVLPLPMRMTLP
jgi:hypothetical protein